MGGILTETLKNHGFKLLNPIGQRTIQVSDSDDRLWLARWVADVEAGPRVEALGQINHPSLSKTHNWIKVAEQGGWILRPWEEGDSPQFDDQKTAIRATMRLAEALHCLHLAGIVHGRIKAGNVIHSKRGLLLLDPTAQAMGEGKASNDIEQLRHLLNGWLKDIPGATQLRRASPEEKVDALTFRDQLEDVLIQLSRGLTPMLSSVSANQDGVNSVSTHSLEQVEEEDNGAALKIGVGIAATILVAALLTVVFILPQKVPQPEPVAQVAQPEPEPPPPEPKAKPTPEELERLLALRHQAEDMLDEAVNLRLSVEEKSAQLWGAATYEDAVETLRAGDEPFRNQEFEKALAHYELARDLFGALDRQSGTVLSQSLAEGEQALLDGDSLTAKEAFELVLAIEKDQPQATAGLARAQTLDAAWSLRDQAREAEAGNDVSRANELYAELVELDGEMEGAREGLARTRQILADASFRLLISNGLASLEQGDINAAADYFQKAKARRPKSAAVADGLQRIELYRLSQQIAIHQKMGEKATAEERWTSAVEHFEKALKLDPAALFAQQGLSQAKTRAELDAELSGLINQPTQWWSDSGRETTAVTLKKATEVTEPGPRLQSQIRKLGDLLSAASQPVQVRLLSDNACEVVVYKVARLGRLAATELTLKPGFYTAVGTRDGYRDVRKDFLVPVGRLPEPVELRCEEPV